MIPDGGRTCHDNGVPNWVEWRPIEGEAAVPLYPDGLQELIDRHFDRHFAQRPDQPLDRQAVRYPAVTGEQRPAGLD